MPEIRYFREFTDDVLTAEIPYEVSDEQLADEAERNAMARAGDLIDSISSLKDAKIFLKRLCKRLFKNGVLP